MTYYKYVYLFYYIQLLRGQFHLHQSKYIILIRFQNREQIFLKNIKEKRRRSQIQIQQMVSIKQGLLCIVKGYVRC